MKKKDLVHFPESGVRLYAHLSDDEGLYLEVPWSEVCSIVKGSAVVRISSGDWEKLCFQSLRQLEKRAQENPVAVSTADAALAAITDADVTVSMLLSSDRQANIAIRRHLLCYALRLAGWPYSRIARSVNRDVSTVQYSCKKARDLYETGQLSRTEEKRFKDALKAAEHATD